jgi:hypothetical protein
MVRLVGSPESWSPADHRAVVAEPREEREERDDRRGRLVSERKEGERERGSRLGRPVLAGLRARVRMGCDSAIRRPRAARPRVLLGRARGERRSRLVLPILFFFFKNVNSSSFCLFQ